VRSCSRTCATSRRSRRRRDSATRSERAARATRSLGLRAGTLVGLRCAPGPAFVELLLAAWTAELTPVLFDHAIDAEERERLEARLGIGWRWDLDDGWAEDLGRPRPGAASWAAVHAAGGAAHESGVVKLSSGSSGPARGIVVPPAALIADSLRLAQALGLEAPARLAATVPLSHSYGFSVLVGPALWSGATLCFPGALEALAAARRLDATFLPSVPAWFRAVLAVAAPDDLPRSLVTPLSAGAPLDSATSRGFRERLGRPIQVLYGASECGAITLDATGSAAERGSVGRALDGVRVELLEHEGAEGRVVRVRSDAVAARYLPAEDDDALRLDGATYTSGDLARREDDELFLLGRTSEWINVRGMKVDPREVEAVIARLPGAREVAVLGVDGRPGEELVRAVVAAPPGALRPRDVVDWCASRLAAHKRPRSVVVVDELPRTARGKLDRARLRALSGRGAEAPRSV